jgi:hypothetical protein
LHQAIAAGIEFPYLLYRIAIDDDIQPIEDYKTGIRTGYLWRYAMLPQTRLHGAAKKPDAVKQSQEYNTTKFEDVSLKDPLPNIATFVNAIVRLARTRQLSDLTN